MISLIIPTLNERDAMEKLLPELMPVVAGFPDFELVVVDDGSTDGTVDFLRAQQLSFSIRIVERTERGLATAVIRGFKEALGDIVCVMDADLSHPPALLSKLITEIQNGADIAVGSRRIQGGGVEEWPLDRKIYSYVSGWFALPLSCGVRDPLSGFFAFKKSVIDGVVLEPIGYKILLEILVKGKFDRAVEVPYMFRNRDVGKSKLSTRVALQYYKHLVLLYKYKLMN